MMLLCPVRPGEDNEELRFALRSWQQNLHIASGLTLVTVGYKPDWLTPDHHVHGNLQSTSAANVWDNIRLASEWAADSDGVWRYDNVLYMNDDFFCMDPMASVLPVKRNLTLAQHVAVSREYGGVEWEASLDLTASWLSDLGYTHPDSYEVHRPLLAQPEPMLLAMEEWSGGLTGVIPQWRTVYGTLSGVEAYPVPDVKLSETVTGIGSPWISTSKASWRKWQQGIRKRFQKPSRWETY
jgi:hypothetical protein